MKHYYYLLAAIFSEVIGTTFLKESVGFTKLVPSIVTVVAYAVTFYCMSQALKSMPTGIAYAIWSGLGIVLIALVAWIVHGQRLDVPALVGMTLIIVGVAILNLSSTTVQK